MRTPRADLRFLLPFAVQTAVVDQTQPRWAEELRGAGVQLRDSRRADLAVVSSGADASAVTTRAILAPGRARLPSQYASRRYAVLPSVDEPAVAVPLDCPRVASWAVKTWTSPRRRARAMLKPFVVKAAVPALRARRASTLAVGSLDSGAPFFVAAARNYLPTEAELDWCLICGQGGAGSRGHFVLFERGAVAPRWVLKFCRSPGVGPETFDADGRGLALVTAAGGITASHAPRLAGRFASNGFAASLETAGAGSQLTGLLESSMSRRQKELLVGTIAAWIVAVGRETAGPSGSATAELNRLREHVLPRWPRVSPRTLDGLESVSGVLQHNDLGCWNIVASSTGRFTVLDWEDARGLGLPLWDLWYFLADALALIELDVGADRLEFFARLFRGSARSSRILFAWTRAAVAEARIEPDLVGRIATLCWLQHGLSGRVRAESGRGPEVWPVERYHEAWLADPQLGSEWRIWAADGAP